VPKTLLVTRHQGARDWAARHGHAGAVAINHLDGQTLASLAPGDRVLGSLPVNLVADVCSAGARYFHLTIDLSEEDRGRNLGADEMEAFHARLEEFVATRVGASPS
jgi:CRISPR-associated protein Csx16